MSALIDKEPRCWRCQRRLADFLARPWRLICQRCKAINASQPAAVVEHATVTA